MARARQGAIITPQGAQGPQGPQGVPGEVTQAQLDAAIEDVINDLSTKWYGVTIPTDGSQDCLPTGNPVFHQNHPFLEAGDVALVLLGDDLTENSVLATPLEPEIPTGADLSGASGQVMVRFKKSYYQEVFNVQDELIEVRWSREKIPGFTIHPFFTDGSREADYAYISAFEAGYDGVGKMISASGVAPDNSVNLATFRSRASARNSGQAAEVMWHAYDHWAQHLLQMYFYLFYGSLDSQGKLPGYTDASSYSAAYKRNTGRSNILATMNGSIVADLTGIDSDLSAVLAAGKMVANRFLFVENIFGHIWKMLDGITFDGRVASLQNDAYICKDPAKYSSLDADILNDYESQGFDIVGGTTTYIKTVYAGFVPKTGGAASSTYFGDLFYSYLDDAARDYFRLVLAGGRLYNGVNAGVACRYSLSDLGSATSSSGSRLCAKNFS